MPEPEEQAPETPFEEVSGFPIDLENGDYQDAAVGESNLFVLDDAQNRVMIFEHNGVRVEGNDIKLPTHERGGGHWSSIEIGRVDGEEVLYALDNFGRVPRLHCIRLYAGVPESF